MEGDEKITFAEQEEIVLVLDNAVISEFAATYEERSWKVSY